MNELNWIDRFPSLPLWIAAFCNPFLDKRNAGRAKAGWDMSP